MSGIYRTATVAACSNHFMELWPCPHLEASSALMQKTVPNNGVDMLCMHDLHTCAYVNMYICTYVHMSGEYIYIYIWILLCLRVYIYIYLHMIYIYVYIYIQIIGVTMRPIMWMPVQTYLPAGYRRTCSVKMTPWNHAVAAFHSAITKKRVYILVRPRFLNQYPEPPAKTLHDLPHFVDQKTWRLITTSKTKLATTCRLAWSCHGASPKKLTSWPSGAAQFFQPPTWFVSQFWHPANGDWETSSIFDTVSAKLKMNGTLKQSSSDTQKKTRLKNKSLCSEG